ncbi:MAG TPA: ABC transporter permease, partial [bacterium]|nr:ABC transporter permease [bacterium]
MFRNYFKTAVRNIYRHKGYSIMNIAGLAIGMAACLLILLFVLDELSYDRFHEKAEHIYRMNIHDPNFGGTPALPAVMGPRLTDMYPEIRNLVRLLKQPTIIREGSNLTKEERFFYVDSTFFQMFSFQLRSGDPSTVLARPNSLVLTRSMAEKYFGTTDVLGRTLKTTQDEIFSITGVVEDPPGNSHFHFDFLASFQTLKPIQNIWERWAFTYVLISNESSRNNLQKKLDALTDQTPEKISQALGIWFRDMSFTLQSLTRIHLHSNMRADIEPGGDPRYLRLYSGIAIFILLIATVNYMNLATARSSSRAREVGVRKVVGAQKNQLAGQFLIEAILFAVIAMGLAFLLAELMLPVFKNLTGKAHIDQWLQTPTLLMLFAGLTLVTGVLSGSYPAFFLARFTPIRMLTSGSEHRSSGVILRKGLVVFQFTISIALIVGTLVMDGQLQYIQQKRLGFDREHILILPIQGGQTARNIKQELSRLTGVEEVSVGMGPPTAGFQSTVEWENKTYIVQDLCVDAEYVETMGLEILHGRDFSPARPADSTGVLMNETAAKLFGFQGMIGQQVDSKFVPGNEPHTLLGVVKDYHNTSFYEPIWPAFLYISPAMYRDNFLLRLRPGPLQPTLDAIQDLWRKFVPD